jgi:lipopolysaccharide export system protein LptC
MLQRWKRRSRLVSGARVALPALCVGIVLLLIGWAVVNAVIRRTNFGKAGSGLEIRMVKPNFQGRNASGKPFLLQAASAVRDDTDSARVTLVDPVFTLGADADKTVVRAKTGWYREDTRILDLRGAVTLDDATGYHFVTEHALVDTVKNDIDGEAYIEGRGPLGRIAASSYSVKDGGAHVYFTGQVKGRIEHHAATAAPKAPAAAGAAHKE